MKLKIDPLVVNSRKYGNDSKQSCFKCKSFKRDPFKCEDSGTLFDDIEVEFTNEGTCKDFKPPWKGKIKIL